MDRVFFTVCVGNASQHSTGKEHVLTATFDRAVWELALNVISCRHEQIEAIPQIVLGRLVVQSSFRFIGTVSVRTHSGRVQLEWKCM